MGDRADKPEDLGILSGEVIVEAKPLPTTAHDIFDWYPDSDRWLSSRLSPGLVSSWFFF